MTRPLDRKHPAVAIARAADVAQSAVIGEWWLDGHAMVRLLEPVIDTRTLTLNCGHRENRAPCACACSQCEPCQGEVVAPACLTLGGCRKLVVEWGEPGRWRNCQPDAILAKAAELTAIVPAVAVRVDRDRSWLWDDDVRIVCLLGSGGCHAHIQERYITAVTTGGAVTWEYVAAPAEDALFRAVVARRDGEVVALVMCLATRGTCRG